VEWMYIYTFVLTSALAGGAVVTLVREKIGRYTKGTQCVRLRSTLGTQRG
jgi:hypothetical protein